MTIKMSETWCFDVLPYDHILALFAPFWGNFKKYSEVELFYLDKVGIISLLLGDKEIKKNKTLMAFYFFNIPEFYIQSYIIIHCQLTILHILIIIQSNHPKNSIILALKNPTGFCRVFRAYSGVILGANASTIPSQPKSHLPGLFKD